MSGPRKIYRVYCFDAVHKVVSVDEIKAASDEETITQAQAQGFGTMCEIWQGKRLVAQLKDERREA